MAACCCPPNDHFHIECCRQTVEKSYVSRETSRVSAGRGGGGEEEVVVEEEEEEVVATGKQAE